jgi:hypothetical protein
MKRRFSYLMVTTILIAGSFISCNVFNDLLDINFETDYVDIAFTVNSFDSGEYTFVENVIQSDLEQQSRD